MNRNIALTAGAAASFHNFLESETAPAQPGDVDETHTVRHLIVQERTLSYRLTPHFHPYVGQLMQRLLRDSINGLQAADTDYAPDGASLPDSLEVALAANGSATVTAGSTVSLLADLQATLPDGTQLLLSSGMHFELAAATPATAPDGLTAVLFAGMIGTPPENSVYAVAGDQGADLYRDTNVTLPAAAQLTLHDGGLATAPAGTKLLLLRGAQLTISNGTQVTLLHSKRRPTLYADIFGPAAYDPSALVARPYPAKDLDFSSNGAYAVYNWEMFFHAPLLIAMGLSKNHQFADAQRWFHYIFDPHDVSQDATPQRFWRVRPFQSTVTTGIEKIMANLSTGDDPVLRDETVRSTEAWKDAPFRPHVVARYRPQAYMYKTVMAYLDNLIAWGDSLFRQDTGEAIDEALMLYVMAADILGPRPLAVPKKGKVRPRTYANLRNDLDVFGNAMREVEADVPFDLMPLPAAGTVAGDQLTTVRSLGKALYFGIPRNDKLLGYWDTVADRLFKIRNSLNFQGAFRQLALFEPPIDPGLLARAAAAGLDVAAVVNGVNQPLPLVRCQLLIQKAAELCQEVRSFGAGLLSAMEKEDGEALTLLRTQHERTVLDLVKHARYGQVQEAKKSYEGLLKSLALAVQRYTYQERLLGKSPDEITKALPQLDELDQQTLADMKFDMHEPEVAVRPLDLTVSTEEGIHLSKEELAELASSHSARDWQVRAGTTEIMASLSHYVPSFSADFHFWGLGGTIKFGGESVGAAVAALARYQQNLGAQDTYNASHSGKMATLNNRESERAFHSGQAAAEITQIFKQLRAAQLRIAVAQAELDSHQQQIENAAQIERFLNAEGALRSTDVKATNKALYAWTRREIKGLYSQCFQLAFDTAKKAERALQHELGDPDLAYVDFGYLAGKEGLLAGEKLHLDVKRMEMAYHDLNRRELEMTKHVSLLQVDPLALVQLRTTGRCTVHLPEALFDLDTPGQYFRRIKSVAVSIPCVVGPYASVNCTLTLLKSSTRTAATVGDGYARQDADDPRFHDYFGSLQSIVTSTAQNDSGMFETILRDERYLPFEHSGAVSEWQLTLPADPSRLDPCQFDYDTISDVVLHLRYTARDGGDQLRRAALDDISSLISTSQGPGATRLFSIREEFPTEWARFQGQTATPDQRFGLALTLRDEHYPFWSRGRLTKVAHVAVLARSSKTPAAPTRDIFDKAGHADRTAKKDTMVRDFNFGGLLAGQLTNIALPPKPTGEIDLFFDDRALEDLWLAISWGSQ
jgi:hypothetical protein